MARGGCGNCASIAAGWWIWRIRSWASSGEGDLPGELIPYVYFEYLRTGEAFKLVPILHHNQIDILTLACLTAIVPWAFHAPEKAQFRHGAEMVGLARWWRQAENHENALGLFRGGGEARAAGRAAVPDAVGYRGVWRRNWGGTRRRLPVLTELAGCRNPFRTAALEELAKYYEHRERNYAMALEMTRTALRLKIRKRCAGGRRGWKRG